MSRARTSAAIGLAAFIALAAVGCAPETPAEPEPTAAPAIEVEPSGDGVLVIGTVTDAAAGGAAIVAGVELAVREINQAGSIGDGPVQVYHRAASNPSAVDELVARGADVVIAPASVVLEAREGLPVIVVTPSTAPSEQMLAVLQQLEPALADFTGASEAYAAAVEAALAAVLAEDDGGASIEAQLAQVSAGDAECFSFGECISARAAGFAMAFAGPSR
ncbi:hypothetical protein [Ruicaihuangia caeni]|uniref:ABC transporter substrate-binding protein n=1 Tax=Ruicaihuangia caeni TaxID=3042517 RepID=A0AAW6TC49_9MICO|nr:hypothetical protein [Klugiella sp. YN-L-19]MDI2098627.1 hypothetical protein [Klugiella sp. YN-L-19]